MTSRPPAPILVTGSHRSGTTWVGRMLCAGGGATYVHEPFHTGLDAGWLPRPVPCWFQYVDSHNEADFYEPMQAIFAHRYVVGGRPLRPVSAGRARRVAREWGRAAVGRVRRRRVLVKDPLALLSSEWLARRFGAQPVVLVRHPAGFVSSLVRMGWTFDFANWTAQPELLGGLLAPYAEAIEECAARPPALLEQGILLWNALYHAVSVFQERHADWTFVRHEDLAAAPGEAFGDLYARLGLRYGSRAQRVVRAHSAGSVTEVADGDLGTIRRDSLATRDVWRSRLDPADVARIRDGCGPLAASFYGDGGWERRS